MSVIDRADFIKEQRSYIADRLFMKGDHEVLNFLIDEIISLTYDRNLMRVEINKLKKGELP